MPTEPVNRSQLRGLFVTGTDTGIGKTIVSAALMLRYRRRVSLRYWKPIQTGIEKDDDTRDVTRLAACRADEVLSDGIRLPRPLSPHLSARLAGTTIAIEPLVAAIASATESATWIVEGAGGVLVPINTTETMADVMLRLQLPVVVVARSSLGTINHTLLTIEALRRRSLVVAGVVMVGESNTENRAAIEQYGDTVVLGQMPWFEPLTPARLEEWSSLEFDSADRLLTYLQ